MSGLRRRRRAVPGGDAISGRSPGGAPHRAALRHRGRPLLAVSASRSRAATGCKPPTRWERPACNSVPEVVALVVRLHTHLGVPLAKVAHLLRTQFGLTVTPGGLAQVLHRTARQAAPTYTALCQQVRESPVVTPDETGLARRRHAPLAVGLRHAPDDGLRDSRRPRVRRRGNGPGNRLRRRARARRVGAVSPLHPRAAPDLSGSPDAASAATPNRSSAQPVGRPGARRPAGRSQAARPPRRRASERPRPGNRSRSTARPNSVG